ncbi:heme-binding protein [Saccharolobus solfataricus]|uniref:Heme-binding protein n=2 Tax=Saccharolobus solfataricus TaxID=2287 RepID=Q97YT3_SACS2|nr:heme-binding protein [Saccharolobus solfataricus]ABP35944.1 hypothetical protein [Saccharolobus solfataricus 98/2]AAK41471.1 Conserved hypothetical protein [Saccharolobus solfataricus P2]AZF84541.1 heme-binding protein [Saccharolobus solfataricus]QPG49032.1 heme-binding protein [Saccharolobus solfataricus]SAI84882.1 cobalamin adenosyltransferase [Saccharolobus solfataricus]
MNILNKLGISDELADMLINEAVRKAKELGVNVSIAIVDEGGELKAFKRMDGAPILTIQIAIDKSWTAVSFGIPTHEWYNILKDNPSLAMGFPKIPRLIIFGGGFPIIYKEQVIGGIGVSGASAEQDMEIAKSALKRLES